MKRLLLLIVLLCVGFAHHATVPVLDARNSAFTLWAVHRGETNQLCSGAIVALPRGPRAITAGHCISNSRDYQIRDVNGNVYPVIVEERLYDHGVGDHDYAILRSPFQHLAPAIPVAAGRFTSLRYGDHVFAWTAPRNLAPFLTTGYVAGVYNHPRDPSSNGMPMVDMNGDGGSSGSILMNEAGEAVGIMVRYTPRWRLTGWLLASLPLY